MTLLTLSLSDSGHITAVIDNRDVQIPEDAISRSYVLRTIVGDVQAGEDVPIPAQADGLQHWLSTVHASTDVQCQALLHPLSTSAVVRLAQVADGLADPIGISAACSEIGMRLFPTTTRQCSSHSEPVDRPGQVLDALPLGLQMRIMRAAPSLKDLLCVLPPHMHVAALSAKIRTIDATSSLQIPHNWCATAAWLPGVATVASLTHLTRLSAATANKGRPTCDALPEAHTDRLLDTLGHLSRLRNLTLCGLRLQNGQTAQLATCMRLLPGLSSLRLSGTIPGGGLLQNVLQPCTALVSLSLAGLLFTSADMHAAAVAAVMPSMQALSTLDLSHTGLTQDMWAQIRTMLPHLHGLHTLNVSNNRLSTVPVDAAKAALAEGADLAGQPREAQPLPLRVIDLTCNDSLESGKSSAASGIVPFIFGQTELTRLELALTHAFSSSSRDVLVEAFGFLRSLRWLGLQKCRIGAAEATALAETFPALQALTLLDLYGNSVRDRGMSVLAKRMAALQELRVLNLGMNNVTDEGVEELVAALPRMPHLRRLHLMSNGIGDQGARVLSQALPDVPSLRNLMLFGNRMSAQGQEVLEGRCAKHGVQVLVARCMV